eukprot:2826984-Prymnesium_polylepis.1
MRAEMLGLAAMKADPDPRAKEVRQPEERNATSHWRGARSSAHRVCRLRASARADANPCARTRRTPHVRCLVARAGALQLVAELLSQTAANTAEIARVEGSVQHLHDGRQAAESAVGPWVRAARGSVRAATRVGRAARRRSFAARTRCHRATGTLGRSLRVHGARTQVISKPGREELEAALGRAMNSTLDAQGRLRLVNSALDALAAEVRTRATPRTHACPPRAVDPRHPPRRRGLRVRLASPPGAAGALSRVARSRRRARGGARVAHAHRVGAAGTQRERRKVSAHALLSRLQAATARGIPR